MDHTCKCEASSTFLKTCNLLLPDQTVCSRKALIPPNLDPQTPDQLLTHSKANAFLLLSHKKDQSLSWSSQLINLKQPVSTQFSSPVVNDIHKYFFYQQEKSRNFSQNFKVQHIGDAFPLNYFMLFIQNKRMPKATVDNHFIGNLQTQCLFPEIKTQMALVQHQD